MDYNHAIARAIAYVEKIDNHNPALEPYVVAFTMALAAYPPDDRRALNVSGYAVMYNSAIDGARSYSLWRTDLGDPGTRWYREARHAVYLFDDGSAVTPYRVLNYGVDDAAPMRLCRHARTPRDGSPSSARARTAYYVTIDAVPALDDWHTDRYESAATAMLAPMRASGPQSALSLPQ